MVTLKLKYECDDKQDLLPILKEGNKVKRIAFNLFKKKDLNHTEVCRYIKENYNYNSDIIDVSILESLVSQGEQIYKSSKELKIKKLIFGNKKNWKQLNNNKLCKEEFHQIRNTSSILFIGKKNDYNGNRKFEINIENNQIIFKHNKNNHFHFKLQTSKARLELLQRLEIMSKNHELPLTYSINMNYVNVMFDELYLSDVEDEGLENRIGSIDLNPNYIGFSICDYSDLNEQKIIFKQVFNLTELNKCDNQNKIDYELYKICHSIADTCKHYKVSRFGIEDLTIKSKNHNKGKNYNKLLNNQWKRNKVVCCLTKCLTLNNIEVILLNASYSSTIGCLIHPNETDCIAASLELNRRCHVQKHDKKNYVFPSLDYNQVRESWNSILPSDLEFSDWTQIHNFLKKKKKLIELRLLYPNYCFDSWVSFRLCSCKNIVQTHIFT